jgi:hypothetical protein
MPEISQTVVWVRSPCQWLGLARAHAVPAGLVLPVKIAAAENKVRLGPDNLGAQLEPASGETGGNDVAVQSSVPDIRYIPGEQRIGFSPVGAIIVEHLALREPAAAEVAARPPARVIADTVRRIGDHQVRLRSRQHWRDIIRAGAVAAANPVVPQQPNVAETSDRLIGYPRNAVRIRQTA